LAWLGRQVRTGAPALLIVGAFLAVWVAMGALNTVYGLLSDWFMTETPPGRILQAIVPWVFVGLFSIPPASMAGFWLWGLWQKRRT
jgi:hypothetical protein